MYGYRKSSQSGLMTNLNSISSSLSSIDTIGTNRRKNTLAKSSVDNLLSSKNGNGNNHMTAASARAGGGWWRNNRVKEGRYSNAVSIRNLERGNFQSSDVYHYGKRQALKSYCLSSTTVLNFVLVLLLLLTILRQTFDFLGQLWLQICINFFTILIIIVALFGIKQNRISYLVFFIVWSLFSTIWNLVVISIHFKVRDINLGEDLLSLNTGAISWWNTNGPGCLPYSITASIHQSVSIVKPNIITGCRFDYHLLESVQAAIHSSLSFIAALICCYVAFSIYKNPIQFAHKNNAGKTHKSNGPKEPKSYRLNELTANGRSAINHDPFPVNNSTTSRFVTESASNSLRRAPNKVSARSSQHSMSSARSERRRQRQQMAEMTGGTSGPSPRVSTSSVQRSQKYGSLSSRRSTLNRRERRAEASSLTYATTTNTTANRAVNGAGVGPRTRLSSLSSADYLPSYQPPHSSSANLLSSYGEISSIDSYNNPSCSNRGQHSRNQQHRMKDRGNANPVYNGSKSSVCSQNINTNNNYDDISNVYGVSGANGSVYGAASSMTR